MCDLQEDGVLSLVHATLGHVLVDHHIGVINFVGSQKHAIQPDLVRIDAPQADINVLVVTGLELGIGIADYPLVVVDGIVEINNAMRVR